MGAAPLVGVVGYVAPCAHGDDDGGGAMTAIQYPRIRVAYRARGIRGLGQTDPALTDPTDLGWTTTSVPGYTGVPATGTPIAGAGGGTLAPSTSTWLNILGTAIQTAGKTAQVALSPLSALPAGSYYQNTPYGTVVATGGGGASSALLSSTLTSTLSSMLPILLIGGAVVLVIMMAKK